MAITTKAVNLRLAGNLLSKKKSIKLVWRHYPSTADADHSLGDGDTVRGMFARTNTRRLPHNYRESELSVDCADIFDGHRRKLIRLKLLS